MFTTTEASSGGIGLSTVLTLIFIVLKCIGAIDWGWGWVLSPLWLPLVVVLVPLGIVALIYVIYHWAVNHK